MRSNNNDVMIIMTKMIISMITNYNILYSDFFTFKFKGPHDFIIKHFGSQFVR